MKVGVLGAGGWGTTLALVLNERNAEVTLWEFFEAYADTLNKTRENAKFLKGIKIPASIKITSDLKETVENSEILVLAVPSHVMRSLAEKIKKFNYKKKIFVSVAKGVEQETLKTMSGVIHEVLGRVRFAVLSGPSHAEEVAMKKPTTVVAASKSGKLAEQMQKLFSTNYFRVYANTDVKGVEIGGSLKNVIAIAAGIVDGMEAGDNTKAALITRGLAEMRRLGARLGARDSTFFGLSGIGDLVVTCASIHSRNRSVGEQLGRGKKISEILKGMEMVAEGVKTSLSAYKLSKKYRVDMPITAEVYKIVYEDKSPYDSVRDLMNRALKSENELLNRSQRK